MVSTRAEGIGTSYEESLRLFHRFYCVKINIILIFPAWFGLYLSAEIIQHHSGQIWLESEMGKGSTFYFNLPVNA
ncbi:MAG: ATP-binding protein [Bacteroidota bacterium]